MTDRPMKNLAKPSRDALVEALRRHEWFRISRPGGMRASLIDHDLAGVTLAGHDLSHANLTGSSFYGSNLSGCRFDSATVFGCDFRQANLENASLVRADLRGCDFAGAVTRRRQFVRGGSAPGHANHTGQRGGIPPASF